MNDHIVDVDDALRVIAGEIVDANKTDTDWAAVESDDSFQRGAWLGGYDADERAFCFSRKSDPELWCQFELTRRTEHRAGCGAVTSGASRWVGLRLRAGRTAVVPAASDYRPRTESRWRFGYETRADVGEGRSASR